MNMYIKAETYPKYNHDVYDVQVKLNIIRNNTHGNWTSLKADGLFGPKTQAAVKAFQIYKNITPVTGVVGDTTLKYINEEYRRVPMIKASNPSITTLRSGTKPYYDTRGLSEKYAILKIVDLFSDFTYQLDNFIKNEINYIKSIGKVDQSLLKSHYMSFAFTQNAKMQELKALFTKITNDRQTVSSIMSQANTDSIRNNAERILQRQAQSKASKIQMTINGRSKQLKKKSLDVIEELKKYNLMDKIERALKNKGISKDISLESLKKLHLNCGKVNLGGSLIFNILGLKDIIWDLLQVNEWGTEAWWNKLRKHLYDFFDAIIIAYASAVIAEIVVGIVVGVVAGAATPVGWIVIAVAIVAVLIATFIGHLCNEANFSFTEYAVQGYGYIGQLIMLYK